MCWRISRYLILFLQPPNLLSSASLVPWAGKIPTSFVQGALGGFMRMLGYVSWPGPVCHASRLNPMLRWAGLHMRGRSYQPSAWPRPPCSRRRSTRQSSTWPGPPCESKGPKIFYLSPSEYYQRHSLVRRHETSFFNFRPYRSLVIGQKTRSNIT
jgi:hypothetical protein